MNTHPTFDTSLYGKIALSQAHRLLGFGDRESDSKTYGCFDRYYWHYRQTDFVNARFQEVCHFLACLYQYHCPENQFYKNNCIREWAIAAMQFWEQLQRKDGSFDEYWPFERSFVATAFSLAAVAETCRLLSCPPPVDAMQKACQWLSLHDNTLVLNQMAGASLALATCGAVLQEEQWLQKAAEKMQCLLSHQSPDGYFEEYGGYDIGYLTINLSYLARYARLTQNHRVRDAAFCAFRFLDDKIRENGTYDYHQTSRKTQYFYPYGFFAFEQWDLLARHRHGLANNEALNPAWMDDRYCLPLTIDYLMTAMQNSDPEVNHE
ncbi:MAG: hypothetical protein C4527_27750 [Candidatus Omnitrophota bacterium]|nr:MAG: hypothetical protein C4527_27750 [Candidatus Omnitrophota bacterium]